MLRIPENEILSSLFIKKFNMVRYIKNDIKCIPDKGRETWNGGNGTMNRLTRVAIFKDLN
jgi:hypothetical protein